jgi:hypothetical protein
MADFPFNNEASQSERRRILAEGRKTSTYHQQAQADADLEMGGRFAKVMPTSVTGTTPGPQYPRQPADSPSNQAALVGDEPPLGVDINAMDPVGEHHELEASKVEKAPAIRRRV